MLIYFALSNNEDIPTSYAQSGNILGIALVISLNLRNPIILAGFWFSNALRAVVTMPKATVDKTANFRPTHARSGFPGKSLRWMRYPAKPISLKSLRIANSGAVFLPRICRIFSDRRSGDSLSIVICFFQRLPRWPALETLQ